MINTLYDALLTDCRLGKRNWALSVKTLLDNYGFSYVWDNPSSVNLKKFHLIFKERVIDVFKQEWLHKISVSGSLILYKTVKHSLEIEHYLDVLPGKLRCALSKLRYSAHQLKIETGRYTRNRLDRSLRLCNYAINLILRTSIILFWCALFMIQ